MAHVTGWNSDAHDILRRTLCKFAGFLDTLFKSKDQEFECKFVLLFLEKRS